MRRPLALRSSLQSLHEDKGVDPGGRVVRGGGGSSRRSGRRSSSSSSRRRRRKRRRSLLESVEADGVRERREGKPAQGPSRQALRGEGDLREAGGERREEEAAGGGGRGEVLLAERQGEQRGSRGRRRGRRRRRRSDLDPADDPRPGELRDGGGEHGVARRGGRGSEVEDDVGAVDEGGVEHSCFFFEAEVRGRGRKRKEEKVSFFLLLLPSKFFLSLSL